MQQSMRLEWEKTGTDVCKKLLKSFQRTLEQEKVLTDMKCMIATEALKRNSIVIDESQFRQKIAREYNENKGNVEKNLKKMAERIRLIQASSAREMTNTQKLALEKLKTELAEAESLVSSLTIAARFLAEDVWLKPGD